MANKPDISRIINKIKSGVKVQKTGEKIKTASPKISFNPLFKPKGTPERNMMQEAMDLGSHGAKDMFKDTPK